MSRWLWWKRAVASGCVATSCLVPSAAALAAGPPPPEIEARSTPWKSYVLDRGRNLAEARPSTSGASFILRVAAVADTPAAWHVQATQVSPAFNRLAPSTLYLLRFHARASRSRALRVELNRKQPYQPFLNQHVALRVAPETYEIPFRTPAELPPDPIELGFYAGEEPGTVWADSVELVRAPSLSLAGTPLVLAACEPGEAWSRGAPDTAHAHGGRSGLRLAAPRDGAMFAARELSCDLAPAGWRLSLWVHTGTPLAVGRVGVLLRSGKDGARDIAFWHFSGLVAGWNHVVIPRSRFVQYTWQGTIDWSAVRSVGVELEANGNGPASVTVDDLVIEPGAGEDGRGPVVDRVNALGLSPTTARIEFRLDAAGDAEVEYGASTAYGHRAAAAPAGSGAFAVSLRGLEAGRRYHARVRTRDRAGHTGHSGDFTFVTEPAHPPVPRGPGLPVGIFAVGGVSDVRRGDFSALEHVARTPFSHVSTFFLSDCDQPDEVTRRYLERAYALGKHVLMTFCPRQVEPGTLDLEAIRARVRRYRDAPALDSWYLWDEPDESGRDPARSGDALRDGYRVVAAEDPRHPVVLHIARADRIAPFHDSMDAIATDTYPVPFRPLDSIVPNLDAARASGLPWRFTFQSYSTDVDRWPGDHRDGEPTGRYPSYAEMRAMAYLAVNRGVSALWTYAYSYLNDTPGSEWHWTELTALAQELRRLGPMLASTTPPRLHVTRVSSPALDVGTKSYAGAEYLIVVNRSARAVAGTVEVTGMTPAAFRDLVVIRTLTPRGRGLADSWAPYQVHLYEVRANTPRKAHP